MAAVAQRKSYVVNPSSAGDPNCPPEDMYTLRLINILDLALGKPFEGEEPKLQFKLEFEMTDWQDDEGENKRLLGWYTPKLHKHEGYPEPKLYKLAKALNGGEPYPLPADEEGNLLEYDPWEELETLVGKSFRSTVGPNAKGWARITGDPLPVRAPRRPTVKAVVVEPEVEDEMEDDSDNNF